MCANILSDMGMSSPPSVRWWCHHLCDMWDMDAIFHLQWDGDATTKQSSKRTWGCRPPS